MNETVIVTADEILNPKRPVTEIPGTRIVRRDLDDAYIDNALYTFKALAALIGNTGNHFVGFSRILEDGSIEFITDEAS